MVETHANHIKGRGLPPGIRRVVFSTQSRSICMCVSGEERFHIFTRGTLAKSFYTITDQGISVGGKYVCGATTGEADERFSRRGRS